MESKYHIPGIYGTPSPFAFSLISFKDTQFDKGKLIKIKKNIFLNISFYKVSILAAQYLNSGILP